MHVSKIRGCACEESQVPGCLASRRLHPSGTHSPKGAAGAWGVTGKTKQGHPWGRTVRGSAWSPQTLRQGTVDSVQRPGPRFPCLYKRLHSCHTDCDEWLQGEREQLQPPPGQKPNTRSVPGASEPQNLAQPAREPLHRDLLQVTYFLWASVSSFKVGIIVFFLHILFIYF